MAWLLLFAAISSCLLAAGIDGQFVIDEQGKQGPRTITLKTPDLSEEESYSHFLPDAFKCDACRAVAYQLRTRFDEFNNKNTHYKGKLPESELLPLIESICHPATFEHYGLKDVGGVHKLTGEGLEAEEEPGIVSSGGPWPTRLEQVCSSFVEELGEEAIYAMYWAKRKSVTALTDGLCRGEGPLAACITNANRERNYKRVRNDL